jgi:hypothetical protein
MNGVELASAIEELDAIYSKLWAAGFRDEAHAIDAVSDMLDNRLQDMLEEA